MLKYLGYIFNHVINSFAKPCTFEDLQDAFRRHDERRWQHYQHTPEHERNVRAIQEQLRRRREGRRLDA